VLIAVAVLWWLQPAPLRGVVLISPLADSSWARYVPRARYAPDLTDSRRVAAVLKLYRKGGIPEEAADDVLALLAGSHPVEVRREAIAALGASAAATRAPWATNLGVGRKLVDLARQDADVRKEALSALVLMSAAEPSLLGPADRARLGPLATDRDPQVASRARTLTGG
jgi:hypothetical protein